MVREVKGIEKVSMLGAGRGARERGGRRLEEGASRALMRHFPPILQAKLTASSAPILLTNSRGDSGKETGEEGEGGRTGQHAGRSEAHHRWEGLRTGTIHR